MSLILEPGQGLLFMKVGAHAQEPLEDIIRRKTQEIEDAGVAFWGYGGGTCHPQNMVQPFARSYERRGQVIYLCMERMDSKHVALQIPAEDFSVDGVNWERIHPAIKVLGSRYALVIRNLHVDEFDLPLARTKVALGNSMGARGTHYVRGRVDKACLEVTGESASEPPEAPVRIGLVAELVEPYAVYVR